MLLQAIVVCLVVGYILKRILGHHKNLPPGPFNIPLLGSWEFIRLWLTGESLTEMYARLGDKYGPIIFMRTVLDAPVVAIRQYEALKEASKDIRLNCVAVPFLYQLMNDFHDYGISFSDNARWQQNKKFAISTLGRLGFTRERVMKLANTECANAVEKMTKFYGQPVNAEHFLFGAITNVAMEVLMSRQFDIDDVFYKQWREDGYTIFRIAAKLKTPYDFAPWLVKLAGEGSDFRTLKDVMDRFYVFCDQIIEEHEASLSLDEEPRDFVDAYLVAMRSGSGKAKAIRQDMSKADLRVILKDLIVGAMEGPSIILAWLLLLVAEHQDVQERMVDEITDIIGLDNAPRLADESRCPYVRAVIVEVLRYVAVTPIHRHSAALGDTTLRGYHIPAGSMVLEDVHSCNHERAVFGDPERFRPERFLGTDGDALRKHEATFGFSARQCPGTAYSHTVLFIFVVGVLQRLKLVLPEGAEPQSDRGVYNVGVRPSQPLLVPLPR